MADRPDIQAIENATWRWRPRRSRRRMSVESLQLRALQIVARRLELILLWRNELEFRGRFGKGTITRRIARKAGVSRTLLYVWDRRFRLFGLAGVVDARLWNHGPSKVNKSKRICRNLLAEVGMGRK